MQFLSLFPDPRWLPKGDRKEQNADRESKNQNVSNAFHIKMSWLSVYFQPIKVVEAVLVISNLELPVYHPRVALDDV